jgi:hypothetical protein
MIARRHGLIPNWIWTEEMARFFFILDGECSAP